MAELVAGAVVGEAFALLTATVSGVTSTIASYRSLLNQLNSTLISIQPYVEDIEKLNSVLAYRNQGADALADRLRKGLELVQKCSRIKCWNFYRKYSYSKKLQEFNESLYLYFQINVQAEILEGGKAALLEAKAINDKLDRIVGNNGKLTGWCGVPGVAEFVVGLDTQLQELKKMLLKDGVRIVVLSAPGGCGKTTLAKLLCHDHQVKDVFGDNIFFQTVSRTPNLQKMVKQILETKNTASGGSPDFQSDEDATNQLEYFFLHHIGPSPVLLVLDDMWPGSEHLIDQIKGCKILVTSRSSFPRFKWTTYELNMLNMNMLNHQDAMTLFRHHAFKDGICTVHEHLVDEVVRGCSGSPLALTVVGSSLCGEDEVKWITTVENWKEGQSIYDTNMLLLQRLKPSLDAIDKKPAFLKDCFLDFGLFPEDQRIPAAALVDIWAELYNLDDKGMRTLDNLRELAKRNLLNLTIVRKDSHNAIDYWHEHFVTQHDLLRELAIHQSGQDPIEWRERLIVEIKGNTLPEGLSSEKKQQTISARILSISTDNAFCSDWSNVLLIPAHVKVLTLNFHTKIYTLPQLMEKMSHLTVLIVTNYGASRASLNNFPSATQLDNLKRLRLENVLISSIATSILQLKNLKKISIVTCEIGDALQVCEPAAITNAFWPNLDEINIEYCDDLVKIPEWLCGLVHLMKISISYCQELVTLPSQLGNLTNLQLLRFHSCTQLEALPESISRLCVLKVLDLSDCVVMDHLPERLGDLCGLRTLCVMGCTSLFELPPSVMDLVQLERLICDQEAAYLWESCYIDKSKIHVVKDDINLNWLHKTPA